MDWNYYDVLGVSIHSIQSEIKRAYRIRAKQFHPDMKNGNLELFQMLNCAFYILRDPERKAEYDRVNGFVKLFDKEKENISNNYNYKERMKIKERATGRERKVDIPHGREHCHFCKGYGYEFVGKYRYVCYRCENTGIEPLKVDIPHGREHCHCCNGYGYEFFGGTRYNCDYCKNTGLEPLK